MTEALYVPLDQALRHLRRSVDRPSASGFSPPDEFLRIACLDFTQEIRRQLEVAFPTGPHQALYSLGDMDARINGPRGLVTGIVNRMAGEFGIYQTQPGPQRFLDATPGGPRSLSRSLRLAVALTDGDVPLRRGLVVSPSFEGLLTQIGCFNQWAATALCNSLQEAAGCAGEALPPLRVVRNDFDRVELQALRSWVDSLRVGLCLYGREVDLHAPGRCLGLRIQTERGLNCLMDVSRSVIQAHLRACLEFRVW